MKIRSLLITFQLVAAIVLFSLLFSFQGIGAFDFWWWMSANLILLILSDWILDRDYRKGITDDLKSDLIRKILVGLVSVLFLYLVFYAGNELIRFIIPVSEDGISQVYGFKGDASGIRISLLMLLVIGPGEELFWRVYLQSMLSDKWGKITGFVIATLLYTGVHVFTGNAILVLAALVCGVFWGWLYLKFRSPLINMISHTLWDLAVFIVFPFM